MKPTAIAVSDARTFVDGELVDRQSNASVLAGGVEASAASKDPSEGPLKLLRGVLFHHPHELDLLTRLRADAGLAEAPSSPRSRSRRSRSRRVTRARRHIKTRKRRRRRKKSRS